MQADLCRISIKFMGCSNAGSCALHAMHYICNQDILSSHWLDLLEQVGFPQRDPARLQLALDHSHLVLWIRSMKQSRWARQGQLLGFARATSEGALNATIWDVAV